jgi:hypothetical protein
MTLVEDLKSSYKYYENAATGAPVYFTAFGIPGLHGIGGHNGLFQIKYLDFSTKPIDPAIFAFNASN